LPAVTAVTETVGAGTLVQSTFFNFVSANTCQSIGDYATYQSSVSVELASASSAAWANYTATATMVGLNVNSGGESLYIHSLGIFAALVAFEAFIHHA